MYICALIISLLVGYLLCVWIFCNTEVKAIFQRDPAANNIIEVAFTYSGLHAIIMYRIAHVLYAFGIPVFPRLISQTARFLTGIEIHPGAKIGKGLFIDHGMGVVIGETSVISDNVTIFQGVTLGGTGKEKGKRHPNIGNNVVVGAGAKVLGNITLRDNVNVGANAVVIKNVPKNATVVGVPGRIVKHQGKKVGISLDHTKLPDPVLDLLQKLEKEVHTLEDELHEKNEE